MKFRKLPQTELTLSEVGFGVWTVATNWWGKIEDADKAALLENAVEEGINFFDTADTYGDGFGEEILAKVLGHKRNDLIIATKFGYDIYDPADELARVAQRVWREAGKIATRDGPLLDEQQRTEVITDMLDFARAKLNHVGNIAQRGVGEPSGSGDGSGSGSGGSGSCPRPTLVNSALGSLRICSTIRCSE